MKNNMSKKPGMNFGGGPRSGGGTVQKPKDFKKTFAAFLKYLKPYRSKFILVAVLAILSTSFAVIGPRILGKMTDIIVTGAFGGTAIDFKSLANIGILLGGLYLFSATFSYLQTWIMSGVSQKITFNLRRDISLKISRLPLRFFDRNQKGDTISLITNDVEMVSQNLNQGLSQILTSFVAVVGFLVVMFVTSWKLSLIALLILPLSFFCASFIVKKSQKNYDKQQKSLGEMNGHIEESFSNHLIVKVFNGEERSVKKFNQINDDLYDSGWRSQFLSGLMMPITAIISNLGYVAVAVSGAWLSLSGQISIGGIQAFIQYMSQFTNPISQLANISNVFQSTIAAAERVFEFLNEKEEKLEDNSMLPPSVISGRVEFNNVCFAYKKDKQIINNFSATVEPKCNVAIVGPTGAGKTTIVNLLMRFFEINSGEIKIDGVDISKMKRSEVRRLFGMVLQDTWLFNGTIAENISFGKLGVSREEIIKAAQGAHADHFIRTLPNGYDTVINDTIDNISAGEKQLLTIARALLANAPMLILDEATSSVDTRTESLIQLAMDKLTSGRTSFVIAHRLSTIKNADLILVMQKGSIVEQGKHKELLAKNGFYANLYNSQFSEE